ncbi:glycosyltransferase family 2 protein [Chondrinema litorale]|uniref:glycosyltransferase family 2 protein n=1 Tax=Chondrinema litorale TaxID=2994555 RepID=UPI0025428710|nr:glycosyltransferase family 2 protein [Chondrinema litorale]UZR93207.1 glycosyltransferase family 2 protein [Chondrinema litorale]
MISVVIPLYNEESVIPKLEKRLVEAAPLWGEEYEIILIDDGSSDGSLELLKVIANKYSFFKIIQLSRNFGHQAAISAGIKIAKGDAVVIMDGDLQDPPEELPRFLAKWKEGNDVVYAIRTRRKEGFIKRVSYFLFYRILGWISDIAIPLDSGDFCVMDKKVVRALNYEFPENIRFIRGLRAFAGFKQVGLTYERAERAAGDVKYTFPKLLQLALDGIFGFSTFPLRLSTYLGIFISIPSFCIGIFFIIHRILDFKIMGYSPSDTPGLATLGVGMFFLGGIMLIILGIIGEYLGRIYVEVKRRPFYIIDEIISSKSDSDNNSLNT